MDEALNYIDAKIYDINNVINRIIEENLDDRDYLSKNVLSNLRYLVEYCFFRVYITDKIKGYVLDVVRGSKGNPQVIISRACGEFVKKLFQHTKNTWKMVKSKLQQAHIITRFCQFFWISKILKHHQKAIFLKH